MRENAFGSKASLTPSPMKVANNKVTNNAVTLDTAIQGACRFCNPCVSISPQEGVGGCRPKPRKSRAVRDEMPATTVKGSVIAAP